MTFSSGVNLIIGENGHGKTNLLEAIYLFKFGRSFRAQRDTDLISFGEPFCRVEVEAHYATGDKETFAASIERNGRKRIRLNNDDIPRLSDLVGRYPCVLFGPHDLALASGAPAERRRFLDMTGSMVDRSYLDTLRGYRRVLAQRNAALRAGDTSAARGVWAEELIKHGCALVGHRARLVAALEGQMRPHIEAMSMAKPLTLAYESELDDGRPEEVGREEHFAARLAAVESEELRRRTTLAGPHRDDLRLVLSARDLRRYGSQGERRLVAVLLRLTELSLIEGRLGEPAMLLLDDLFSELDPEVSSRLKTALGDADRQVFVTSPIPLEWGGAPDRVIRVRAGHLE